MFWMFFTLITALLLLLWIEIYIDNKSDISPARFAFYLVSTVMMLGSLAMWHDKEVKDAQKIQTEILTMNNDSIPVDTLVVFKD